MKNIKHIIFDLGGVLLNIDYQKTIEAFEKLGIPEFQNHFSQAIQNEFFERWECGEMEEDEFYDTLCQLTRPSLNKADVRDAWNSMLLNFPLRRLQILQQLQLHYDLFLLSNTNVVHEKFFNELLMQTVQIPTLNVFFDKVYLSHRVGLRKPDLRIFQLILEGHNLNPKETLFIDDSIQHIEAAEKLGLQTFFLKPGLTIEKDVFKNKRGD